MIARSAERTGRRSPVRVLLAVPLAAGALVASVVSAPPAEAVRVQVSDTRFTSTSQQVTISVQLGPLEKGKLGLTPPGGSKPVEVASGTGPKKLSYTMSLSCPDYDGSCVESGQRTPARNGKWTVTFGSRVLVLGGGSESSFVVDAPPQAPRGVSASAPSTKQVAVQWRKGVEPDLSAYQVSVGGKRRQLGVGPACSGSSCTATVPAPGGGRTSVQVVAISDGADGKLSSPASATKVTVPQSAKTRVSGGRGPGQPGAAGGGARSGAGFPSTGLGGGDAVTKGSGGFPVAGQTPASDPYPSFGTRPEVAPVKKTTATEPRRATELVAYGQARGDFAVPVALGLVLVLATWHLWLLTRTGRLRPAFARVRRVARGRHSRR